MNRHFVSYPKSGRTWIRFILAQLGIEEQILFHHAGFEFNDAAKPPLNFSLKDHLEQYSKIEKLVYLTRDPRDIIVSLYFQVTGRFKDYFHYDRSIAEFIRDDYFGAVNLQRFREMWNELSRSLGFLQVSYEMCHRNMVSVMHMMLSYYEFDIPARQIEMAVHNASFEKMKAVELSRKFPHPWLRPRNESLKVRRGKVGGFHDYLSEADEAFLNRVFRM